MGSVILLQHCAKTKAFVVFQVYPIFIRNFPPKIAFTKQNNKQSPTNLAEGRGWKWELYICSRVKWRKITGKKHYSHMGPWGIPPPPSSPYFRFFAPLSPQKGPQRPFSIVGYSKRISKYLLADGEVLKWGCVASDDIAFCATWRLVNAT